MKEHHKLFEIPIRVKRTPLTSAGKSQAVKLFGTAGPSSCDLESKTVDESEAHMDKRKADI